MINYFNYQFDDGKRLGNAPFVDANGGDSPWDRTKAIKLSRLASKWW
jgi:hypothetical protein